MRDGKFKLQLIDLFWVTGLAACIAGSIATRDLEISLVGTACVLFFVWHRPVMLRFWTLAMIGIGTAVTVIGVYDRQSLMRLKGDDLVAWGLAMTVVGALAFVVFALVPPPQRP
jgi:hypothetical protein